MEVVASFAGGRTVLSLDAITLEAGVKSTPELICDNMIKIRKLLLSAQQRLQNLRQRCKLFN